MEEETSRMGFGGGRVVGQKGKRRGQAWGQAVTQHSQGELGWPMVRPWGSKWL